MPGYDIKISEIEVGSRRLHVRSLKDNQQYADPEGIAERGGISSANWSLFGVLSPSAMILARYMNTLAIADMRILEIGCGLGLASLIAAQRKANITASDYHPLAKDFLNQNCALNKMPEIDFFRSDWRMPITSEGKFDLIIGGDLLYERDHAEQLARFVDCHAKKTVKVVIVDPGRGNTNRFMKHMIAKGYDCQSQHIKDQLVFDKKFTGRVVFCSR